MGVGEYISHRSLSCPDFLFNQTEEDLMDGGSKLLPSNGLGYMSTVKFAYNGEEFEFSTTEPESTKKKAEQRMTLAYVKQAPETNEIQAETLRK